ncbi:Uu.00g145800.m01.CDS01 [Anthostomella pinea]|uniref:Uu.00g145800.m01.CDS01 n=1 Tax=Anthostomella pinea TaxID=933095 RepID=A0AAI8VRY0_9PEZI|nr:Uu.00g145800.m01.CDS01 [Anthostomella pinea]
MASATSDLSALPNEILSQISGYLVLPLPDRQNVRNACLLRERRKALWSLCLMSRKLNKVATSVLYRTVRFWHEKHRDGSGLGLFLRTLVENAQLRPLVRQISCLINLTETSGYNWDVVLISQSWASLSATLRLGNDEDITMLQSTDLVDPNGGMCQTTTGERVFGAILCFVTRLEYVYLQCPHNTCYLPASRPNAYGDLDRILRSALATDEGRSKWPFSPMICPVLLHAPDLKLLAVYKAENRWSKLPNTLQSLDLADSPVSNAVIEDALTLPNLRNLILRGINIAEWECAPTDQDYLNTAMSRHLATKLVSLELCLEGQLEMQDDFGPSATLHSLATFQSLERLKARRDLKTVNLEEKLPTSLVALEISVILTDKTEMWWDVDDFYEEEDNLSLYNGHLITMFYRFAKFCKQRCPRLESISWCPNAWFGEAPLAASPVFTTIMGLFQDVVVKLEVNE